MRPWGTPAIASCTQTHCELCERGWEVLTAITHTHSSQDSVSLYNAEEREGEPTHSEARESLLQGTGRTSRTPNLRCNVRLTTWIAYVEGKSSYMGLYHRYTREETKDLGHHFRISSSLKDIITQLDSRNFNLLS